jgi:hypothetical protein
MCPLKLRANCKQEENGWDCYQNCREDPPGRLCRLRSFVF